jgi:hypothetical protein
MVEPSRTRIVAVAAVFFAGIASILSLLVAF